MAQGILRKNSFYSLRMRCRLMSNCPQVFIQLVYCLQTGYFHY